MASIVNDAGGQRRIVFMAPDGNRKTIRLGKVTSRTAQEIKSKVERLVAATGANVSLDLETAQWIGGLGDKLAAKLAAAGLIPKQRAAKLGDYLDAYVTRRTDIKPRTRINLIACKVRLTEFFGADKPLRDITPGDADAWLLFLRERYANGTAGRTVKRAKQFFRAAVRDRLLSSNPFDDVKPPSQANESRKFFVTREMADAVLQSCPDAEWRLIFSLCRFGGLRCPSELLFLKWGDVDWERERILIHSPKTEHLEGGGERWLPMFPELRSALEETFEAAEPGTVHVINRYRDGNQNLRTQLGRIIRRAGLKPWPKLFHNLRATRETELAADFPLHVVCTWIGNTAMIAQKHYLQVPDSYFQRASQSGAKSGSLLAQKAAQSPAVTDCQEYAEIEKAPENRGFCQELALAGTSSQELGIPPRGLEPRSSG